MKQVKLNKKYIWFCSFIFSVFCIIGYIIDNEIQISSFVENRINIIVLIILTMLLTCIISLIIHLILEIIKLYKDKEIKTNKINEFIKKRLGLVSFILIILCWIIYIVAFYPTVITVDAYNQLKSFFNLKNYYSDSVVLLSESMLITNFHPVVHTLLLRWIFKAWKINFE